MVKADVKHNYYADLELPTTCSIDDVKKQYRRLALLYHPDRNAGKEEEVVPKFQAIQTAHEVLSDPVLKSKYDTDRRKAGLYPSFRPAQQTQPSSAPYAATSPYPPPPRRTQPGTWQRAQPAGNTPTGADRFTNFTRGAPTARKDPTADRSNNFRAWQNLNTAQERQQQRFSPGTVPPMAPPQPSPTRPRPPPRTDTKLPSEEEIRAGMNYRKGPAPHPPGFDADRADARQSAWAAFQHNHAGKPGVGWSNTTRTPRKPGFDPNLPGSDERPAADGGYAHRHRSEDFGRMPPGTVPPPPPGPPPVSPTPPTAQRPFADQMRPSKSRGEAQDPQAPYAEANRKRTPYTSFIGEKTQFARESPEGLRRTASTRDTTKLNPNSATAGRARSTSPLGRHAKTKGHDQQNGAREQQKPSFVNYSDSDMTDNGLSDSESQGKFASTTTTPAREPPRPGTAPQSRTPFERPKKVLTPSSRRVNGNANPFSPPPQPGNMDGQGQAQPDSERPGMQQKTSNTMYVDANSFTTHGNDYISIKGRCAPFERDQWRRRMFGTRYPTYSAGQRDLKSVPQWAMPSSVEPGTGRVSSKTSEDTIRDKSKQAEQPKESRKPAMNVDIKCANATPDQQSALAFVRRELEKRHGEVPDGLDMDVFLQLASTVYQGHSSGNLSLDKITWRAFNLFPLITVSLKKPNANTNTYANNNAPYSFSFPFNQEMFTQPNKTRSEEQINTKFTPEEWNGQFTASGDYFAPPPPAGRKPSSPGRRRGSGLRSATHVHAPPPPWSSPGTNGTGDANDAPGTGMSGEVKFSKEQWEKTFQDASWTWPPPPPPPSLGNPPSPSKRAAGSARAASGRKASKPSARSAASASTQQPHVVDEDDTVEVEGADGKVEGGAPVGGDDGVADADAMDIDTTPPAMHKERAPDVSTSTQQQADGSKEPRLYAVPPSAWRQSQQGHVNGNYQTTSRTSANGKLKTDLDDLAHVEPLNHTTNAEGLKNLADMSSTLPFHSQASAAIPTVDEGETAQKLQMPPLPKAPEPPTKLTKQSWRAFAAAFRAYLQAFHTFNSIMLQHFAAREGKAQAMLMVGTAWLEATGDITGPSGGGTGFRGYLRGVREDEELRECWSLGCERHAVAVGGFERARERVRKMVASGGLVEQ